MSILLLRAPVLAILLAILGSTALAPQTALAQLPDSGDAIISREIEPSPFAVSDDPRPNLFRRVFREGEWYFAWGYNTESWGSTNIHISQPSLGNNFIIHGVRGHDEPSWDTGLFNKDLFVPQTNMRLGRFVDSERTLAVEFNLDHTKYTSNLGQYARVTGTIAGMPTDAYRPLDGNFFQYRLHNGANHAMIDLVKRFPLIGETNETLSVAGIGKVGVGLMVPHAENTIMGHDVDVGQKVWNNLIGMHQGWWQVNGCTTGVEFGFRVVLFKPFYLEFTDKVAYAYLGDVPVYRGTASHSLWMNEIILSLGVTYGGRAAAKDR